MERKHKCGHRKGNVYTYLGDGTMSIYLGNGHFGIIDEADFDILSVHTWHLKNKGTRSYIASRVGEQNNYIYKYAHSILIEGKIIDHIDGNGLNNSRKNLRSCSNVENRRNSRIRKDNKSGFKGVSFSKQCKKWSAKIGINGRNLFLGYFSSPIDAARAYDNAAIKHFGSFARTNHQMGKV